MCDSLVLLAIESKYNDNNGDYEIAYLWDGEKMITEGGMYADAIMSDKYKHTTKANNEQRAKAVQWYRENAKDIGSHKTYSGCVVILKGSRKAPNKTPLEVTDYADGYYDSYYRQSVPAKVKVNDVWVSASCIDQVVLGKTPYWA